MNVSEINHAPSVVIPMSEPLRVPLGVFWEFPIPNDVFFDEEDGDVTNLELSLTFMDGQRFPPDYWLQVDKNRRVLTGLLLVSDLDATNNKILLVGTDLGGLSAETVIQLDFETPAAIQQTHKYDIAFSVDYDEFMREKESNLKRLLGRISSYFGDEDSSNIRVLDLRRGSLVLSWNNVTLNGLECNNHTIKRTFTKIMRRGETIRSTFIKHMQPEFNPLFVEYELVGACANPPVVPIVETFQTAKPYQPVFVDPRGPEIFPSSASVVGMAPSVTDHLYHSGQGSGLMTEGMGLFSDRMDVSSVFGSGGMWTIAVAPPGSSQSAQYFATISPQLVSTMASSSAFILPPDFRPDFVTDPVDTRTESSTDTESSTSSTTSFMEITTSKRQRQKTTTEEMTSSREQKTLPWVSVEPWTLPAGTTEGTSRSYHIIYLNIFVCI